MPADDTTPAAHATQIAIWRAMAGEERVLLAIAMSEEARAISLADIHHRQSDYSEADARMALMRLLYGDELVRAAWPHEPLRAF